MQSLSERHYPVRDGVGMTTVRVTIAETQGSVGGTLRQAPTLDQIGLGVGGIVSVTITSSM